MRFSRRPRRLRTDRGFTIVEVMAVVAIIAVLSVLAIVGYRRWIARSYTAEGTQMIGSIRDAEEHWYSETKQYLDVSGGLGAGFMYPAATPGAFRTTWGGVCATCKVPWGRLDVSTGEQLWFGFAVVADTDACDPACKGVSVATSKGTLDFTAINGGPIAKPWFVALALADTNGDGVFCKIVGHSFGSDLIIDNEGE